MFPIPIEKRKTTITIFEQKVEVIGSVKNEVEPFLDDIQFEPSFTFTRPENIRQYGGKISNMILDKIPMDRFKHPVIDIRASFLKAGGSQQDIMWHIDTADINAVCSLSAGFSQICNTKFATKFTHIPNKEKSYDFGLKDYFDDFSEIIKDWVQFEEGKIVCFDRNVIHSAVPARIDGWRLFFRIGSSEKLTKLNPMKSGRYSRILTYRDGNKLFYAGGNEPIKYKFISVNVDKNLIAHDFDEIGGVFETPNIQEAIEMSLGNKATPAEASQAMDGIDLKALGRTKQQLLEEIKF